jgi:hypothetical protein
MKLWMRLLVRIGLALFLAAFLAPGYAADAHMYRCVNANGRVYYSDLPGTECVEGEHDRLTRDGLVLDRPIDEAENEAAAAETAAERKRELLAQNRHDRMLICDIYIGRADRGCKTAASSNSTVVAGIEHKEDKHLSRAAN